jgi:plastocyanin
MRKLMVPASLAALAAAAIAMPADAGRRPKPRVIEVGDNFFSPSSIRVKDRARVVFEWDGTTIERHNIRATRNEDFYSGRRGKRRGDYGPITINADPGDRIRYICEFHPIEMRGTIRVTR